MKLLIQPEDGVMPLVKAIASARKHVHIAIFRFDQREVERALANAVSRGVAVYALIAHTNRAGEEGLRKLELRLLAAGVTVARTADDLIRYHGKWLIIDGRELYLLAFNFTHQDIEHSRSFGVITRNREAIREAMRLFEADTARQPFETTSKSFLVSPLNARHELAQFIQAARKELIIYDPKVSDRSMIRLLMERARAGVQVRIIGRTAGRIPDIACRKMVNQRLHTRSMVRDGLCVFVGSQSLREMELDERREVGLIFRDAQIARKIRGTFEADWKASESSAAQASPDVPGQAEEIAKKVAKAVSKELPQVAPLVDGAVHDVVGGSEGVELVPDEVQQIVKGAVKEAVREVVKDVLAEAAIKARGAASDGA